MNIIFMGTPAFAIPTLRALLDSGHDIKAVYTQPPKPAGRGMKLRKSDIHILAEENNISVETPKTLKNTDTQENLKKYNADIAVVAAYGLLLPEEILTACPNGCVNIHPSLLPRWRGAAPIQRPIMAGDKETGVTIMQMDKGLDTGDMLLAEKMPLANESTAGEMHDILAEKGAELLLKTLDKIENSTIKKTAQDDNLATYADKISKDDSKINWHKTAQEINAHIRGLTPFPGAYFNFNGERIRVTESSFSADNAGITPGTTTNDKFTIACGEGSLTILRLKRQGKKEMSAEDFLRGCNIPKGTSLE